MASFREIEQVEIITDKLYWLCADDPPSNLIEAFYFSIDEVLVYYPYCSDFGPLNLGCVYRYCSELEKSLEDPELGHSKLFHYTSKNFEKRANSAFLMCAFQVIVLGRTAECAWGYFSKLRPFRPFRDASRTSSSFYCYILDCLRGLERAIALGWFDYRTFNIEGYEINEQIENGDISWVIPGKLLAFSCPATERLNAQGNRVWTPEDYSDLFKILGVSAVVRPNSKTYDATRFTSNGINHKELYFIDGSCPSDQIVNEFLAFVESQTGAVAVHCKAGLGRTGTLIGCYAMKHYNFPALDFIGWIRICRPGSVIGPQQHFLVRMEDICRRMGRESRTSHLKVAISKASDDLCSTSDQVEMSPDDEIIAQKGDLFQADYLIEAKRSRQRTI